MKELAHIVEGNLLSPSEGEKIFRGVSIDSRTIGQGQLFVPLVREKDGHDFIAEAIGKGAAAALWQNDRAGPPADIPVVRVDDCLAALQRLAGEYRSRLPVKVIGITGSNGKTTTKDMIDSILGTTYKVHKTKGNLNSQIGMPLTLLEMPPDVEYAVVEMGMSERGQIERLSLVAQPDFAVITMIGVSHLSTLGSREQIAEAKLEIVRGLRVGGTLVYNGDEPLLANALEKSDLNRTAIGFGQHGSHPYRAASIAADGSGISFRVNSTEYRLPMLGKHNVTNALAAIAVGELAGVEPDKIRKGLEKLSVTEMRMEVLRASAGFTVINDAWNASPVSVAAAIETFGELEGYSHKFLVLGDMRELGAGERQYHREIGQKIDPRRIQYVFTVGELAEQIALEAADRFPQGRVAAFRSKDEVLSAIRSSVAASDAVLVKGSRGMELEHIVRGLL